ncbi:MAG: FG-GAP-like repeat-containing protein [bacterium]|nr:FG-GAP-like repeat-containing protein [bacterium]
MLLLLIICSLNIEWQTDWSGGAGTVGTVSTWGNKFWQSESLTYNVQGQVSPVSTGTLSPLNWTYHIIASDMNISGTNGLWPADFDNNGYVDLAGWEGEVNQLVFYKNDGNNNFTKINTIAGPGYSSWAFLYGDDFNGDGLTDLVVCSNSGMVTNLYTNTGNFNFSSILISTQCTFFPIGGDIDNDNDKDLVLTNGSSSPVQVYKNISGVLTLNQTISIAGWRSRLADLNNDGYNDLVLGGPSGSPGVKTYLNDSSGFFDYANTLGSNWALDALLVRDLDNDGDQDIICGAFSGQNINLWWFKNQGDGINYTLDTIYDAGMSSYLYGDGGFCEDLDFDGNIDIASGATSLGWFKQTSTGNFTKYDIPKPTSSSNFTHWVYPIQLKGTGCFKKKNIDMVVCWDTLFVWYENNMVNEFSSGWLESSILKVKCDSGNKCDWKYFGWKVCCPFYKAIMFQIRSGKDSADIVGKDWSEAVKLDTTQSFDSVDISTYTKKGEELFQYKINFMGASDVGIVDSVWVTWECSPFGVEEKVLPSEFVKIYQNKICYYLPDAKEITLSLYDITGRLVKMLDKGKKSGGYCWVDIPSNICSGVYLVKFTTEKMTINRKLIIVK